MDHSKLIHIHKLSVWKKEIIFVVSCLMKVIHIDLILQDIVFPCELLREICIFYAFVLLSHTPKVACGYDCSLVLNERGFFSFTDISLSGISKEAYESVMEKGNDNIINMSNLFTLPRIISFDVFHHTLILTDNGLYGMGHNHYGQLGLGDNIERIGFNRININNVILFKCGGVHSFVLTKEGLFSCGSNEDGQLGLGDRIEQTLLKKIDVDNVLLFTCKYYNSGIVTDNGVFVYGEVTHQFGYNKDSSNPLTRFVHFNITSVISIDIGADFIILLTNDGLFGCGANDEGQLGLGDRNYRPQFEKIDIHNIISASCHYCYTLVLTIDGLYGFGYNFKGAISHDRYKDQMMTITKININIPIQNIITLCCGDEHTIIVTKEGMFGSGSNKCGQLSFQDIKKTKEYKRIDFS